MAVLSKKCYWKLDFSKKLKKSENEWEEIILKKIKESIRLQLRSDVNIGFFLSGGIDSSIIVALASNHIKELKTFSIAFNEKKYDESKYAKIVAEKYKTKHTEFNLEKKSLEKISEIVKMYDEPFADSSALPTWYLSKICKKDITVAVGGDGGDENFGGYERYNAIKLFKLLKRIVPFKKNLSKINLFFYQKTNINFFKKSHLILNYLQGDFISFYANLISCFKLEEKEQLYTSKFISNIQNNDPSSYVRKKFEKATGKDDLDKVLEVEILTYLPDDLLMKVDMATMNSGLEVRSPFLDHELMELTAKNTK